MIFITISLGPSASPVDAVHSSSDQMLKVDSISTDVSTCTEWMY